MSAKKFDGGKPPMSLLPYPALVEVAKVLEMGKKKYGAHNWRGGMDWTRFSDACLRHLYAWINGEDLDDESGLTHLAHAACNLMFLLTYEQERLGIDDRFMGNDEPTKQDTISTTASTDLLLYEAASSSQA